MGKRELIAAVVMAALIAAAIVMPPKHTEACGYRPQAGACDGWSAGRPKMATVSWLVAHDSEFADWLLSHNEHGKAICGWRPAQR